MIRRAENTDMSAMDPTPDQIRERTKAIRATWTPRERARRSGIRRADWMPPTISEFDLPGGVLDFDTN